MGLSRRELNILTAPGCYTMNCRGTINTNCIGYSSKFGRCGPCRGKLFCALCGEKGVKSYKIPLLHLNSDSRLDDVQFIDPGKKEFVTSIANRTTFTHTQLLCDYHYNVAKMIGNSSKGVFFIDDIKLYKNWEEYIELNFETRLDRENLDFRKEYFEYADGWQNFKGIYA